MISNLLVQDIVGYPSIRAPLCDLPDEMQMYLCPLFLFRIGASSILSQVLQSALTSLSYRASDVWSGEERFDLNDIYTSYAVINAARAQRGRRHVPFVLVEAVYESPTPLFPGNEYANEAQVRSQAYEALWGGAFGQFVTNNPVWHLGPGWQRALNSPGAQSTAHLHDLMTPRKWWLLQPDGADCSPRPTW